MNHFFSQYFFKCSRSYQIFLPLLSLFIVRVDLTDILPLEMSVRIVKIYDGDTVLVKRRNLFFKVRISRIDAPEKGQRFIGTDIDAGDLSTACLKKMLSQNREYQLSLEGVDLYQRYLGDIERVSLRLVQQGCALLYPFAVFQSKKDKSLYLSALHGAKINKRGMWEYPGLMTPYYYRKLNKRGEAP